MSTEQQSTITKQGIYATTDGVAAGCIAYWQLSGRATANTLAVALNDLADVAPEDAPRAPSSNQIFARACRTVVGRSSIYMMDKHPRGGFAFVAREVEDDEPTYKADLHAWLGGEDQLVVSDNDHPLAAALRAEYADRRGKVDTTEVSDWLIGFAKSECQGVSLRPSGGFYYIPNATAERFRAAVTALRSCSEHTVFEIPAMSGAETASAIIKALRDELEAAITEIQEWAAEDRKRQERGYKTKLAEVAALEAKLTAYADFMDDSLDDVARVLEDVAVELTERMVEGAK